MGKDINLLSISHSFIKKINLNLYFILEKFDKLKIYLIIPVQHKEENKILSPDFDINNIDLNIYAKKTFFNHLRFKIYLNLKKIISENKITHILLDQDLISLQSIVLLFNSYIYKYKIIYLSNENNIIEERNLIKKFIKIILYKLLYFIFNKKIKNIFCYTDQIKNNLDVCGLEKITKVLPLGFDDKIFFDKNNKSKNDKFIISYFGRINRKKGIKTLIKSLNKININNWEFHIDLFHIESLDFFKEIKNDLKNLYKSKRLKIIKSNHNNIAHHMQNTHLTVVPSEWNEQYGRVIQEAAACGSLVIGTNVGAIPEIINDNAFIFEQNNIENLTKKIEDIYFNYNEYCRKFKKVKIDIQKKRSIKNQAKIIYQNLLD